MSSVLVLQSFREHAATSWVARCCDSVQDWCRLHHYDYQFCGDALFDRVPQGYMAKVGDKLPIAADLARLLWIEDCLRQQLADVVIWLDADVFVFAPQSLAIQIDGNCTFGHERWLQKRTDRAGYRVHKNVHNAYCAFRPHSPVLPFLIDAMQRMIERVDAQYLAPQFVGPKLLTSLHNIVGFDLDSRFGAISPDLRLALCSQNKTLVKQLDLAEPMMAANLCASLNDVENDQMHEFMDVLASFKSGLI